VPETTVVDPNSLTGNHRHRVADERRQGSRVVQSGVIVTLTAVPGRLPANLIGGQAPPGRPSRRSRVPWPSSWDAEVPDTAAFIASDRISAMPATVANLGARSITD
jgi:hypothetical protein